MMANAGRLHLFGIRHHGPGCAHAVEQGLAVVDPAIVLIEGPPEAIPILKHAAAEGMVPPVSILVYARDEPRLSSFYPFADYSPEWRVLLWALRHGRPVRFIDLPAAWGLAERKAAEEASSAEADSDEPEPETPAELPADQALAADPLGALAEAAGYE